MPPCDVDLTRPGLYLAVVGVVLVVNLLPAFGPPTWLVLVLFRLHAHLWVPALVVLGALAAVTGRVVLALATARLRSHVGEDTRERLEAARNVLQGNRKRVGAGLLLFLLSPVPSAQLFEAAGLVGAPLRPLAGVFLLGRLASYSVYAGGIGAVESTDVGKVLTKNLTSPIGVGLQVLLLLAVYALTKVDWRRFAGR